MIEESDTEKPTTWDELTSVLRQRSFVCLLEGAAFIFQMQNTAAIAAQTRLDASTWHCHLISWEGQDIGLASLE